MVAPAAGLAPVCLWIPIAFEAPEDVVGLQTQLRGTLGSSDRAHAAVPQQHQLLAVCCGLLHRLAE